MPGTAYLVASGDDDLLPRIAAQAYASLGKPRARIAVSYAPVAGDGPGLRFMTERMRRLFPDAILEAIDDDPSIIDNADLAFVSGGDPTLGAKVLERTGVAARMRAAHARGVPMFGVSAGAILLGQWWVSWPDTGHDGTTSESHSDAELLAHTSLVRAIGIVERYVFDTHDEEDDWDELRIVATLLRRRGEDAVFLGIPRGGALVFSPGAEEKLHVEGVPPFQLR